MSVRAHDKKHVYRAHVLVLNDNRIEVVFSRHITRQERPRRYTNHFPQTVFDGDESSPIRVLRETIRRNGLDMFTADDNRLRFHPWKFTPSDIAKLLLQDLAAAGYNVDYTAIEVIRPDSVESTPAE